MCRGGVDGIAVMVRLLQEARRRRPAPRRRPPGGNAPPPLIPPAASHSDRSVVFRTPVQICLTCKWRPQAEPQPLGLPPSAGRSAAAAGRHRSGAPAAVAATPGGHPQRPGCPAARRWRRRRQAWHVAPSAAWTALTPASSWSRRSRRSWTSCCTASCSAQRWAGRPWAVRSRPHRVGCAAAWCRLASCAPLPQVAKNCKLPEGTQLEFTGILFQPGGRSPRSRVLQLPSCLPPALPPLTALGALVPAAQCPGAPPRRRACRWSWSSSTMGKKSSPSSTCRPSSCEAPGSHCLLNAVRRHAWLF